MLESWRSRANADVSDRGHLLAGWRLATSLALAAVAASSLVWLRDYLSGGIVPMLPVLGAASAVTFVIATVGFPTATALWIGRRTRAARLCGLVAMTCWIVTAVVFQLLLGGSLQVTGQIPADQMGLLAWTFLAAAATAGLWQAPPGSPRAVGGAVIGVAVAAIFLTSTGVQPLSDSSGYLVVDASPAWLPAALDGGANTLHTSVLVSWALLMIVGIVAWRIDPRPAIAALWLLPFVLLSQLPEAGPAVLIIGLMLGTLVIALGATRVGPAPA